MSTRLLRAFVATIAICGFATILGCGGVQAPPEEGTCNPGREWVAPTQNADGEWQSGYCRAIG